MNVSANSSSVNWKMRNEKNYRRTAIDFPCRIVDFRVMLKQILCIENVPSLDVVVFAAKDPEKCLCDDYLLKPNAELLIARMPKSLAEKNIEEANRRWSRYEADEDRGSGQLAADSDNTSLLSTSTNSSSTSRSATGGAGSPASRRLSSSSQPPSFSGSSSSSTSTTAARPTCVSGTTALLKGSSAASVPSNSATELDEDARIKAVIAEHAQHRGPTGKPGAHESLAHRYMRNKNFTWSKDNPSDSLDSSSSSSALLPAKRLPSAFIGAPFGKHARLSRQAPPPQPIIAVSTDYICHMCGLRGHHIKNCSRSHDNRHQKRVRPATGIPANFLRKIDPDEIPKYTDVYVLKDGNFAVMRSIEAVSGSAYFSKTLDQKICSRLGSSAAVLNPSDKGSVAASVAQHLKCRACARLFRQPVVASCCGETYCRSCVSIGKSCKGCGAVVREVQDNRAIQDSVDAILKRSDHTPYNNNNTIIQV